MEGEGRSLSGSPRNWLAGAALLLGGSAFLRALWVARRKPNAQSTEKKPRVIVLGGGFAGLEAARTLQRLLPGRVEVALFDRHNYQLFTPLLYQVAACGMDPYSITYPLRHISRAGGIVFRTGTVEGFDLERRRVRVDGAAVSYDFLVIALGSVTDFGESTQAPEHALPIKSVGDGIAIRNHVLSMLERGARTEDPEERRSLLTFAIVGGGPTGVETAAALAELLDQTIPSAYPGISRDEVQLLILEAEDRLLRRMRDPAPAKAMEFLHRAGVEVRLSARVRDAGPDGLITLDGESISARTTIWAGGVRPPEVIAAMDGRHGDDGALAVDQFLRVRGRKAVYAVGDCAHIEDRLMGRRVPWLADAAIQEGRAAAENIARAIEGRPQNPFQYRNPGTLITFGRSYGLAQFGRLVVSGVAGAVTWHAVHLLKIPTLRERISTALDWSAGYLHDRHTSQLDLWPVPTGAESKKPSPD